MRTTAAVPWYLGIVTGLVLTLALSGPVSTGAAGLNEQELGRISEAMQLIRTHALEVPKSTRAMTDDILRAYCRFRDTYGDYLTEPEYTAFINSNNSDYFGVEMDIEKKNEHIYLYPFRGGIAEQRGIRAGDELMAVNGAPVYGKSVFLVGSTIRGTRSGPVSLTIRHGQGIPRVITLHRQQTSYHSVRYQRFAEADVVQITRFVKNSADLLQAILEKRGESKKTLIIDLRGNQGGSLRVARRCMDFFLPAGTILFHLRTREKIKDIAAELPVLSTSRLILLQDRVTASAAEVFIAALTENGRAISMGEKSYGKGLAQRFLLLSDGSALRLTYAEILTPTNNAYNGTGLTPNRLIPPATLARQTEWKFFLHDILQRVDLKQE